MHPHPRLPWTLRRFAIPVAPAVLETSAFSARNTPASFDGALTDDDCGADSKSHPDSMTFGAPWRTRGTIEGAR